MSFVANILSGGVTGILGVLVQRFFEYKTAKVKMDFELALRKSDAEIMAQEWKAKVQIAETQIEVEDAKSFGQSFDQKLFSAHVKPTSLQSWVLVLLDFCRGIIRPGLTIYLCVLTTLIYAHAKSLIGTELTPDKAFEVLMTIVNTILYLTTTCVLFWFGTRNRQTAPKI